MSADSSVAFSQFLFFGLSGDTAGLSVGYGPVRVEITVIWVGINEVFVLEGTIAFLLPCLVAFILGLQKVIRRQFPDGHWTWPRSLRGVRPPRRRPGGVASSDLDNDYCIGAEGAARPTGYCVCMASCRTCCGVGGGYVRRQWVDPPTPHWCWWGAYWSGGGDSHVGYWNPGPNSSSCCSHTGIHWSW